MDTTTNNDFFKSNVLGHPAGLFVLFFTEMWERFSFYGMRVLLVMFLTAPLLIENPGWEWPRENAMALFGTYAGLLYLTPILGGMIADKFIGYRWAIVIGALIMTLGHVSIAIETPFFLYLGLALLVIGTGFFKPNMTSIISEMYKDVPEKKDGAYTIFYMGVNAGAFFGMMMCGYLAEKIGWSYGFGLAGIFMLLGTLQFWLAKPLFGTIGNVPSKRNDLQDNTIDQIGILDNNKKEDVIVDKLNPFTLFEKVSVVTIGILGFTWIINDPLSKIGNIDLIPGGDLGSSIAIFTALILLIIVLFIRIIKYFPVVRDRMIAVTVFAFFTVFFWASFEQGAGSLVIFARDYTDRSLVGNSAIIFKIVNTLLTIIPLSIITWVLFLLAKQTFKKIALSNIVLTSCFIVVWGIVIWMLNREFTSETAEVTASWFSILNSFFIIALAPFFSKWWESKYNPSAATKYGLGLIIMAIGFGLLAYGTSSIPQGATTASISMIWLIVAYLFHTMGELCLSPVGLSYVSKLVPARMIAFMFGIWYLAIAIGNKLAGSLGGMIDDVTSKYDLSTFFLIFTIVPFIAGAIVILLNPILKKLMHGVK